MFKKIIEKIYFKMPGNLAFYDAHTDLYNRNWWEMIGKKKYNNKEIYIVMLDINNLKTINDTRGHFFGDMLIQEAAIRIKTLFPDADAIHLGGDEFLILTKKNPKEKLERIEDICCYGYYEKTGVFSIRSACRMADEKMYNMKKEKKGLL